MRKSSRGFALISAILALGILTCLGILVFVVSTQGLRISSRGLGEKKAMAAAETGIHLLLKNFDPLNRDASIASNVQVDPENDPETRYSLTPSPNGWVPEKGPSTIPISGFSMGGGETWGRIRSLAVSAGTNTRYNSNVQLEVGIGYGPVNTSTSYP